MSGLPSAAARDFHRNPKAEERRIPIDAESVQKEDSKKNRCHEKRIARRRK